MNLNIALECGGRREAVQLGTGWHRRRVLAVDGRVFGTMILEHSAGGDLQYL